MNRGVAVAVKRLRARVIATSVLLLILVLVCCAPRRSFFAPRNDIDSIARSYVRLALALGERDPDSLDFSLASASLSAEVHKSYPSLDTIRAQTEALSRQLHALHVPAEQSNRVEFLAGQLAAIEARTKMLQGQREDFDTEARSLFGTTRLPDTRAEERRMLRAKIAALLPVAKPGESEADRYARYNRQFIVPRDKLLPVMNAALALCRQRTAEHITLPPGESVDLTLVRDKPWAAFSRYMGHAHSVIALNLDMPLTVDDALELACHEGYPGHHVFNMLRDQSLVQRQHLPEAEVQLTFSPQSYLSEAAAAYAPEMAFAPEERAQVERDVLFPLAGLRVQEAERAAEIDRLVRMLDSSEPAIAHDYVDGTLEFVRAEQVLAGEALMANSEPVLLYLNEYRSYMLAYTDGPRRLAANLATVEATSPMKTIAADRTERWKLYEQFMRTLQFHLEESVSTASPATSTTPKDR